MSATTTREALIRALPAGALPLGLSDWQAVLESGARVYAYVATPDNPTPQPVRVPSRAYYEHRLAQGWTFVLFYAGAGSIQIRRA